MQDIKILSKKEYHKEYRKKNHKRIKELQLEWKNKNYERVMWNSAKARADQAGYDFTIKVEDIVIPEYCPYLGWALTKLVGHGNLQTNASIDRIDSSKGYTKDNIQILSNLANKMKNCATEEQLIVFAKNVLKIHETS